MDWECDMFERWYVLEAGASMLRLYDPKEDLLIRFTTCYLEEDGRVIAYGNEALQSILHPNIHRRITYPLEDGRILHEVSGLLQNAFQKANVHEHLLKPSLIVYTPFSLGEKEKEKWTEILLNLGIKKVRFVNLIELYEKRGGTHFLIHAGHSLCEMAIFIHGKCQIYKSIPFAGKQVDENIQQAIAHKKNCLISQEEAKRLKEEANISFQRKLPSLLHGIGMDRYQRFVSFSILSSDLWPSVDEVEKQIILWAKSLFDTLSLPAKAQIAQKGIELTGGSANLYSLSSRLQEQLQCPIFCSNDPEYDMLKLIKENFL